MLKAMIKRAMNLNEEKVLLTKTLRCIDVRNGINFKNNNKFML